MSVDAVLTHPHSPLACGVVKFSYRLARSLNVPCFGSLAAEAVHPLLSVKGAEFNMSHGVRYKPYDLFAHDAYGFIKGLAVDATRVYAANPAIADGLRHIRPDVITAFCPSTVEGNPDRGGYRVLTFGMSHKLVLPHFEKLKRDLERDHPDYTISLSTAVHEGNPWDDALTSSVDSMRAIFGGRLRVLGFLADDALARELQECDAVAAFFVPAFRANNTSAWAALSAGKFLYTNLDKGSPALDPEAYGWDALLKVLA
jgi:hypothetical protein